MLECRLKDFIKKSLGKVKDVYFVEKLNYDKMLTTNYYELSVTYIQ